MLGAIAGDVIGSVHEFIATKTMDFELFVEGTRFTDDTVLAVAVADCLLNGGDYVDAFHEYFAAYPDAGFGAASTTGRTRAVASLTEASATGRRCAYLPSRTRSTRWRESSTKRREAPASRTTIRKASRARRRPPRPSSWRGTAKRNGRSRRVWRGCSATT